MELIDPAYGIIHYFVILGRRTLPNPMDYGFLWKWEITLFKNAFLFIRKQRNQGQKNSRLF